MYKEQKGELFMNVVICEDEKYWIGKIKEALHQWASMREIKLYCISFSSPQALIEHLMIHKDIDVLLLDISLGNEEMDGVIAARHIRKMGNQIPIIFITVDSVRAADGYLVEAIGFLEKPINQNRLTLFLDRIAKQKKNQKIIKLITEDSVVNVNQRDILYAEVNDHTIIYHTVQMDISFRGTLKDIHNLLGEESFVQIHRSYIIAKDKINKIKTTYPYSVNVFAGLVTIDLPVSRKYIERLKAIYSDNIMEMMM